MTGRWPNASFDYSGAHVLVTGGMSGLGGAIAEAIARRGRMSRPDKSTSEEGKS